MKALGLPDAVATPMYDAFQSKPSNSAPFNAVSPTYPLLERNPNTAANRALSRGYDAAARSTGAVRRVAGSLGRGCDH